MRPTRPTGSDNPYKRNYSSQAPNASTLARRTRARTQQEQYNPNNIAIGALDIVYRNYSAELSNKDWGRLVLANKGMRDKFAPVILRRKNIHDALVSNAPETIGRKIEIINNINGDNYPRLTNTELTACIRLAISEHDRQDLSREHNANTNAPAVNLLHALIMKYPTEINQLAGLNLQQDAGHNQFTYAASHVDIITDRLMIRSEKMREIYANPNINLSNNFLDYVTKEFVLINDLSLRYTAIVDLIETERSTQSQAVQENIHGLINSEIAVMAEMLVHDFGSVVHGNHQGYINNILDEEKKLIALMLYAANKYNIAYPNAESIRVNIDPNNGDPDADMYTVFNMVYDSYSTEQINAFLNT